MADGTFTPATAAERRARQFAPVRSAVYDGARCMIIRAGYLGTRHVVPPAGPEHAFDVDVWAREVQVTVSPGGRSARVFVDGQEVPHVPREA